MKEGTGYKYRMMKRRGYVVRETYSKEREREEREKMFFPRTLDQEDV